MERVAEPSDEVLDAVDDIRAGRPRVLVVVGDAADHTLDATIATCDDADIVRVPSHARERTLPYAVLVTLLLRLGPLPRGPLTDLATQGVGESTVSLGVALIDHLSARAEKRAILLVVPRLDLVDVASTDVLLFAMNRLENARVGLLAGTRTPLPDIGDAEVFLLDGEPSFSPDLAVEERVDEVLAPAAPRLTAAADVDGVAVADRDPFLIVVRAGERAAAQGARLAAAQVWSTAATLAPDPPTAAATYLRAAAAAWDAGRPDIAVEALGEAGLDLADPAERAAAAILEGQILTWTTSAEAARTALLARAEDLEPEHAATLLVSAAAIATMAAHADAEDLARRALRTARACGASATTVLSAQIMLTHAALMRCDGAIPREVTAAFELGDEVTDQIGPGAERDVLGMGQMVGFDQMIREEWRAARTTFGGVLRAARQAGYDGAARFAAAMDAEVAWRIGRWPEARAGALSEAEFVAGVGRRAGTWGDPTYARVEAALGHVELAVEHAGRSARSADALGLEALGAWSRHALGLAALADGRPEDAIAPLEWVAQVALSSGPRHPGILWWHGDLLEAYVATGRVVEATRLQRRLEALARSGNAWCAAICARAEGLLRGDRSALTRSAQKLDALGAPFEAARSRLALAELGDRGAATAALGAFTSLGAAPWVERARLAGGLAPVAEPTTLANLTPAELRVALAVGRGRTTREAASELALSPRTVDAHLQAIYRKLQVRSRTQLALVLGERGTD